MDAEKAVKKPIALQSCEAQRLDFEFGFRYQYVVGPERLDLPGFNVEQIGSQWVHTGRDLRRVVLRDSQGQCVGILLGVAVDHNGKTPEETLPELLADGRNPEIQDTFERYLVNVAGRYAFIVQLGGSTWYYCDPVGMIGAVTARETRRIAASPGLCIDRPFRPSTLYDNEAIAAGEGTYGLCHTSDRHVFRHNANHRLDLEQFSSTRFWPRSDDSFSADPNQYGSIYDEIIAAGGNIVAGMTRLGETSLPLSGGNDSRLILAVTGAETRNRIDQIFTHINNYANRRDSKMAAAQCEALGLVHEAHDRKKTKVSKDKIAPYIRLYKEASAMPGPVPKEIENGLCLSVREGAIVMRGHQCNILRGQYLKTSNPEDWKKPGWQIQMMRLVGDGQFNADVEERFSPDTMAYYRDLPPNALERATDFIFLETLVPAALGPLFTGQPHAFFLSPFNSRRLVQLFMQPDTAYRRTNGTTHDLILRADPVLFPLPYNYDLPADMVDTEQSFSNRRRRCKAVAERHAHIFDTPTPDYEIRMFGKLN